MLDRSTKFSTAIAYHEAGYAVAGRTLGIIIRPPQLDRGLRRHLGDVIDLEKTFELAKETGKDVSELPDDAGSVSIAELFAVVFLAGSAASRRCDANATGDRDGLAARNLIFADLLERFSAPLKPAFARTYLNTRMRELAAEAEKLINENWHEIEVEAARLAAK